MPRIVTIVLAFLSFVATVLAAPASNILEKKLSFPSPIQWKSGNVEVSLIAAAWGPANSPEIISKGREKLPSEKPEFFPDRPYALALQFQAKAPGLGSTKMYACSGWSGSAMSTETSRNLWS